VGQDHVYCCVAVTILLTTVCKCLGAEETSCLTSGRGCCPISDSSCSTLLRCEWQVDCVRRQMFLQFFLRPCGYIHDRFTPVFNTTTSDGTKIDFSDFYTGMFPDSLNCFIILWTVDDKIFTVFALRIAESLPIIIYERLCLLKVLFLY